MLTVGVLLKSLTGIWPFIILTIGGSAQVTDWCLALYYAYYWSSAQVTDWYLGLYYTYCCSSPHITDCYLGLYYTYCWGSCSSR